MKYCLIAQNFFVTVCVGGFVNTVWGEATTYLTNFHERQNVWIILHLPTALCQEESAQKKVLNQSHKFLTIILCADVGRYLFQEKPSVGLRENQEAQGNWAFCNW